MGIVGQKEAISSNRGTWRAAGGCGGHLNWALGHFYFLFRRELKAAKIYSLTVWGLKI